MLQPVTATERMLQTLNKQMHREIESAGRISDRRKLYMKGTGTKEDGIPTLYRHT